MVPSSWVASYKPPLSVIFVLGGPGSGKTTQAKLLSDKHRLHHLSAGELLRRESKQPTTFPNLKKIYDSGAIVPAEITVELLRREMERIGGKGRFVIDGFPRNMENVVEFERRIESAEVPFVLFFDCDEETLRSRIEERAKTGVREDDTMEVLQKRLQIYRKDSLPIVEYYRKQGVLREIDASGSVEKVRDQVERDFMEWSRKMVE